MPCADRIQLRTFVVVPELVRLRAHDRDTTIVRGGVIRHRAGKRHIQTTRTRNDLIAPIGVNFT